MIVYVDVTTLVETEDENENVIFYGEAGTPATRAENIFFELPHPEQAIYPILDLSEEPLPCSLQAKVEIPNNDIFEYGFSEIYYGNNVYDDFTELGTWFIRKEWIKEIFVR